MRQLIERLDPDAEQPWTGSECSVVSAITVAAIK
jgi:hypothetical protein